MQAGGEPHHGQVDESAEGVIPQLAGVPAVGAGIVHRYWCGVDDGEGAGVSGTGDGQSDFCGAADGIGDEIATSPGFSREVGGHRPEE